MGKITSLASPEVKCSNSFLYLIFSFFSGTLETGILTSGIIIFDLSIGLALVLAYQIGCLARNPLHFNLKAAACALGCAVLLFQFGETNVWLLFLSTVFMSSGLQSAREYLLPGQNLVSVSTKRLTRVAGFVFGIIGCFNIGLTLIFYIAIVSFLLLMPSALENKSKISFINLENEFKAYDFGWIMFFHQTHYFVYAYVLLSFLLSPKSQMADGPISQPLGASMWFALGWFSYISASVLLKKILKLSAFYSAIVGHAWVVLNLGVMLFLVEGQPFLLKLTWVFCGFGGGSVYAIKELAKADCCKADLELWEHWGHVSGVTIAFMSVQFFPTYPTAPFCIAIAAALITLILLLIAGSRTRQSRLV